MIRGCMLPSSMPCRRHPLPPPAATHRNGTDICRAGRRSGHEEGRALGLHKGFEVGHEVGYYSGCCQVWRQLQARDPQRFR